jgi:LuxR family maltose regulon positive regulatory protein
MGSVIEILVAQALAHQAQGSTSQAFASLERALTLAKPEGYVRIFVDEGEPIRLLILDFKLWIEKQSRRPDHGLLSYTDKLLSAFERPTATLQSTTTNLKSAIDNPKSELIEPLSQRELEVLRLIAQGLSNAEISQRLFLALSTIKGHNLRIFAKLQVQSRTEAVARARELGLL